jgi:hypothetical protein
MMMMNHMEAGVGQAAGLPLTNPPKELQVEQTVKGDVILHYRPGRGCALLLAPILLFVGIGMVAAAEWQFLPMVLGIVFVVGGVGSLLSPFARRSYRLQREELWIIDQQIFGRYSTTAIPKADITAVRLTISDRDGDELPSAKVRLLQGDKPIELLDRTNADTAPATWLAAAIAAWAGLVLQRATPDALTKVYKRPGNAAAHPSWPRIAAAMNPSYQSASWVFFLLWFLLFWACLLLLDHVLMFMFVGGPLLLFGLWLGGKVMAAYHLSPRLQEEGVTTQGVITQRWIEYADDHNNDQYYVAYLFPGGVETKTKVQPFTYERLQVGNAVTVYYLPTAPTISQIDPI